MPLRDYQAEDLEEIVRLHRNGVHRQLLSYATGLGKTHTASEIPGHPYFDNLVREHGMIFVNHRREILFQSIKRFKSRYPDLVVGLEMGENESSEYADINFLCTESVGRESSNRLMEKYKDFNPAIIVVDEAHHLKEDGSFDNTLNWFGVGSYWHERDYRIPGTDIKPLSLALTATPEMPDGRSYEKWIDPEGIVSSRDVLWGIRNGWLTDIRAFSVESDSLGRDEMYGEEIDAVVKLYLERLQGLKTLVFARSVEQSKMIQRAFNDVANISCGHVDAETDPETRARTFERFAEGVDRILTNRLVCTEGWDDKGIQAIIDLSPTSSRTTHRQKVGRGLRTSEDARVDDYDDAESRRLAIRNSSKPALHYYTVGNPSEHSLNVIVSLTGMDVNLDPSNGDRTVMEYIELVENFIEEQPERDISSLEALDLIDLEIVEHNIWNRSVYQNSLDYSDLRWCRDKEGGYAIYIEGNPFTSVEQDSIWWLRKADKGYRVFRVLCGGYIQSRGYAIKEKIEFQKFVSEDRVENEIKRFDLWLKQRNTRLYNDCRLGTEQPALTRDKKYLKTKGIKFNDSITERSALFLKDAVRIDHKQGRLWK